MRIKQELVLAVLIACLLGGVAPSHAGDYPEATAMFLRLFDYIDADGDGVVPLAELFRQFELGEADVRAVKSIRELDRDADGSVGRDEARVGIIDRIEHQVQKTLGTDADGDGQISLIEYALSDPDTTGQAPDADGVTPAQRSHFKRRDLDGDGIATRAEIVLASDKGSARAYWIQLMRFRIKPLDRDGDGMLDRSERAPFRRLEPKDAEDRISMGKILYWFYSLERKDRAAIDAIFDKLEDARQHAEH